MIMCVGCMRSRRVPGASYLLGARNPLLNKELVGSLCALLEGVRPDGSPHSRLISHVDDRPGHDLRYAADPSKAENDLGWRAEVSFDDGLADTVRWYLANGDWCAQVQERYQRERLGLARAAQ